MAIKQGSWQAERMKAELARGEFKPGGPVAQFLAEPPKALSTAEIDKAAKRGHTISFKGKSECFDDLSYRKGVVTGTFWDGRTYDQDIDLETFLEWCESGSVGHFYNEILGRDWFGSKKGD